MKVFLINLDRHPDRLSFMERQLNELDLEWERLPGVEGTKLTEKDLEIYSEKESIRINGVPLTPGHMGCSLSHIRLYEKMVQENIPACLVLEDDVVLSDNVPKILEESWTKRDYWDYVHFSYTPMGLSWLKSWFGASWKQIKKSWKFVFYFLLKLPYILFLFAFETIRQKTWRRWRPKPVKFLRPLYHTGAYVVSNSGARKMLDIAYPLRYAADRLPNQARVKAGLRFYGYCPAPVKKSNKFASTTV